MFKGKLKDIWCSHKFTITEGSYRATQLKKVHDVSVVNISTSVPDLSNGELVALQLKDKNKNSDFAPGLKLPKGKVNKNNFEECMKSSKPIAPIFFLVLLSRCFLIKVYLKELLCIKSQKHNWSSIIKIYLVNLCIYAYLVVLILNLPSQPCQSSCQSLLLFTKNFFEVLQNI